MKRSIHIEAPVETVFDFFKDPEKSMDMSPFDTRVDDMKVTREGVGTYAMWHAKVAGLTVHGLDVLTDVIPNRHITERSSNSMVGTWEYDFEPEGSGTKVTLEHHPQSFWGLRPIRTVMDLATERMSDTFMARVKDAIETRAN